LIGVQEYLVFDPTGEFLGEQVRGWRRGDGGWQPWPPETRADDRQVWHSAVLGLAARPEGLLLRFDRPAHGTLPVRREIVLALAREQVAREDAEKRATQAQQRATEAEERATQAQQRATEAEERAGRREQDLEQARAEVARLRALLEPPDE
jgi:hypothetical protein